MALIAFATGAASPAPPSDLELQEFVKASVEVHRVIETSEANPSASPEESAKFAEDAKVRMEAAVTANGLSTDRYQEIYEVMQNDPKVLARVTQLVKQEAGE